MENLDPARILRVRPIKYSPGTDQIQELEPIPAEDMQDVLDSLACDTIEGEAVIGWHPYTHRITVSGGYEHAASDYLAQIEL